MRILVVEDDSKIRDFVEKGLRQEGYQVETADNGADGFHLIASESYDAAVVDVMLPRMSGVEMIAELRRQGNLTPALILSARASLDDRVGGLHAGADDYLTKPFSFTELLARIQALIRRSNAIADPVALECGALHIDLLSRKVSVKNWPLDLQPKEFSLLEYLVRNQGRVVSKTMIMEHVWGYDFDPRTNVVESRVSRLRDKIDVIEAAPRIRTVRGAGYVIEAR